jgi:hypothetical protein
MKAVPSPEVPFFFVWQPVLAGDARERAAAHERSETDGRARHYWDTDLALGLAYAGPLASPLTTVEGRPLAWDVVMLFARGALWDPALPHPARRWFPGGLADGTPAFAPALVEGELRALSKI